MLYMKLPAKTCPPAPVMSRFTPPRVGSRSLSTTNTFPPDFDESEKNEPHATSPLSPAHTPSLSYLKK